SDRPVDRGPVLFTLLFVAILLAALRWNRSSTIVTLVSTAWFFAVMTGLLLFLRLPGRVLVPMEVGAILLAVVVPAYLVGGKPRSTPRWPWAAAAIVIGVSLLSIGPAFNGVRSASRISRENALGVQAGKTVFGALQAFDPQGIYAARGDVFGRWDDPLKTSSPFKNPRLIPLGWATNSPMFD